MKLFSITTATALIIVSFLMILLVVSDHQVVHSQVQKRILKYAVDYVQTGDTDINANHWAYWNTNVATSGTRATTSIRDDSVQLTPLNVCPSFFSRKANRLFIDSNGFISFQPFSMCALFCFSGSSIGDLGYYDFKSDGSRGDWPMIAGYLYDLDPSSGGTISFLDVTNGTAGFVDHTIVEYNDVPPYRSYGTGGRLNLQILIARNGTIVVRFQSALTNLFFMSPATGLVLSSDQREVLPRTFSTNLSNWRLSPVEDPCQAQDGSDCNTCLSTSYSEGACVWCASTKQCVNNKVAKDVCAGTSDTFTNISEGDCSKTYVQNEPILPRENNTAFEQVFYTNSINGRKQESIGSASFTSFNFDTFTGTKKNILNRTSQFPVTIDLPFNFSFFNFPNTSSTTTEALKNEEKWKTSKIRIHKSGVVRFKPNDPTNFPWAENCDPIGGYCASNNFPPSLSPFSSSSIAVEPASNTVDDASIRMIEFAERTPASSIASASSSPYCDSTLAAANSNDPSKCAKAVAFEIRWFRHRETLVRINGGKRDIRVEMKVRVMIDEAGNVGVHLGRVAADWLPSGSCGEDEGIAQFGSWVYPAPTIGLMRFGTSDYSSMNVPMYSVGDEHVLAFSPVKGCPSCNSNGACNTTSFKCVCKTNYAGEDCSLCAPGYYGRFCDQCPTCQNGGTCDDGSAGSGSCVCSGQFSGEFCSVDCGSAAAAPCESCSLFGGICTCGSCACRKNDGWFGDDCSVWRDPCDRASLAGCRTCLNLAEAPLKEQCFYCEQDGNERCMSKISRRRINASLLGNCGDEASSCRFVSYPRVLSLEYNGTLGIIAFVILTILTLVGITALICCRGTSPNPFVISAVPGVPDFRRPPREREVIQIRVVDPRRIGLLQGIPLKTVPILDLYQFQKARRQQIANNLLPNAAGDHQQQDQGSLEVPGQEYLEERMREAQEVADRFANAGPVPASPRRQRTARGGNNNSSDAASATSARRSTSHPTLHQPTEQTIMGQQGVADNNSPNPVPTHHNNHNQDNNYNGVPTTNNGMSPPAENDNNNTEEATELGEVRHRRHTPQEA